MRRVLFGRLETEASDKPAKPVGDIEQRQQPRPLGSMLAQRRLAFLDLVA